MGNDHDTLEEVQRLYTEVRKVSEKNLAASEKVDEFIQRASAMNIRFQQMEIRCEQTYKRLDEHLKKWHSRLNRLTKAGALAVAVFAIAGGFAGMILAQAGARFLDWAAAVITAWWAG